MTKEQRMDVGRLAGLCAAVALAVPGAAQEDGPLTAESGAPAAEPQPEGSEERPARLSAAVRAGGLFTFDAELDGSPGDVSVWRTGGGVDVGYWLSQRVRLSVGANTELSEYDFDGATGLVPGVDDPIDLAQETSFGLRTLVIQNADLAWFGGGEVTTAGEEGAELSDALTFGGVVGARWQVHERFVLTGGFIGASRLEEDPRVLPIIGVDWRVNDKVRVSSTGPGTFEAFDSVGVRVFADVTDDVEFMLGGRWKQREYRLSEDSTAASGGVFRDGRLSLDVGLLWSPDDTVSIGVVGGVVAWQEFAVDDGDGDEISDVNTDPAPFIGIGGKIEF